ncbi:hypothetical protein NLU13_1772 [Sarocladium strictum]|uniref:PhoD-like phosphatase domain-containing protein n=1 Tax=Sarocladium strictum TaxID=5046 RepID=A0AA39GSF1_SARSR|nr:hypothetical protein NLU13_1772 [Sarocladium strictum]
MPSNNAGDAPHAGDEHDTLQRPNPYTSESRWRHQESSAYLRFEGQQMIAGQPREPTTGNTTGDLADFLNKTRIEPAGDGSHAGANHQPLTVAAGHAEGENQPHDASGDGGGPGLNDGKEIVCGPLLNYRRMEQGNWIGSVLVVVKGGGKEQLYKPTLALRPASAGKQLATGTDGVYHAPANGTSSDDTLIESSCLYSDSRNTFWQFDIVVPMGESERQFEYEVPEMRYSTDYKPRLNRFFIPALTESMRIMFHSCNGFSVGTDEEAWSGAALWNDVMRKHSQVPFHVMVGGGDQIYNDGIRVNGPLRPWTDIKNPKKRREYPFPEKLRAECDDYYLKNYIRWYNISPFAYANGQIPQLNIWDDHDIIDGFGSYTDHFMRCAVFRGIGGTAHKYYMLFQHHLPPPPSTFTTDSTASQTDGQGADPNGLLHVHVAPPKTDESYIWGQKAGPYVAEKSLNIYTRLGARMALVGIDARVERTRHQINYPETYDLIFERLRSELKKAAGSDQPIKHLILLLGIPIAYPRLTWLENILRSPLIGPVKFMSKRFGVGGGLFNQFDGSVDLLDDLDDHYTARVHKKERTMLIERMQRIAAEFSVRVTILGGDVHLAALGRFYSNPSLKVPVEEDHRYMANVVSSAIVNKPPPQAVANLLARRNKIHHLNPETDETLLDIFDKDPGDSNKTANFNHVTMPSRNYAMITENSPNNPAVQAESAAAAPVTNGEGPASDHAASTNGNGSHQPRSFVGKDGHDKLHAGEVDSGTKHRSATLDYHGRDNDGSLHVRINVEIDQHDKEGKTQAYGLMVPLLHYNKAAAREHVPSATAESAAAHQEAPHPKR